LKQSETPFGVSDTFPAFKSTEKGLIQRQAIFETKKQVLWRTTSTLFAKQKQYFLGKASFFRKKVLKHQTF
jgi:hypothetical protein